MIQVIALSRPYKPKGGVPMVLEHREEVRELKLNVRVVVPSLKHEHGYVQGSMGRCMINLPRTSIFPMRECMGTNDKGTPHGGT